MTISVIGSNNVIAVATGGVFTTKMSGIGSNQLAASPAFILSRYIIDTLGLMGETTEDVWPLYVNHLPDAPSSNVEDDCGVIYDTTGVKDGRLMSGEVPQHFGIQLRIRSLGNQEGYVKIEDVAAAMDEVVAVELSLASGDYVIQNVSRTSPVIPLGIEGGTKRRFLFTINFLVTMKKV